MNGAYKLSNALPSNPFNTEYPTSYKDVEYFDVYSPPITTKYGEVYWTMMDEVPLEKAIVDRFHGKVMAIVGFEADQVMQTSDGDVSVPITWAYNHHFEAYLKGSLSEMRQTTSAESHKEGHGLALHWHLFKKQGVHDPTPESQIPVGQWFSEGNGGEFRKSYHGYPHGMAQLIESPVSFQIQPMQIDTKNRHYNGSDFRAGVLPACSAAPPNASYSGLLECPCATRIEKNFSVSFSTANSGLCQTEVHNAKECFDAVAKLGIGQVRENQTVSDSLRLPTGCSYIVGEQTTVFYNQVLESSAKCGGGSLLSGSLSSAAAKVDLKLEIDSAKNLATITMTGPSTDWFSVGFNAPNFAMADMPYTIVVDGKGNVDERKLGNHAPGTVLKQSVKVVANTMNDGKRTVVMQRGLKGLTSDHYTFDGSLSSLPLIFASGTGPTYAYHGPTTRSGDTINLAAIGHPTCVCYEGLKGTINGIPFSKNCLPEPKSDLLAEKNPTCFVDTYH